MRRRQIGRGSPSLTPALLLQSRRNNGETKANCQGKCSLFIRPGRAKPLTRPEPKESRHNATPRWRTTKSQWPALSRPTRRGQRPRGGTKSGAARHERRRQGEGIPSTPGHACVSSEKATNTTRALQVRGGPPFGSTLPSSHRRRSGPPRWVARAATPQPIAPAVPPRARTGRTRDRFRNGPHGSRLDVNHMDCTWGK